MTEITEKKSDSSQTASVKEVKPYVPVSDDKKNAGKEENIVDDPRSLYEEDNTKESKEKIETPKLESVNYKTEDA
jgi:hypothetical protein